MTDFDSPWKEALDIFFEPFLALLFSEAHADVDWARGYEPLDKELQQIAPEAEVGRRFVDKLVKVWLKSGLEQWVLIHVEVQASKDPSFAWRMYVYNYRLFDRYNRKVASFAVLGDDDRNWRPSSYGYSLWGVEVGLKFPTAKLLDFVEKRQELEGTDNVFASFILAHLYTLGTRNDQGERKDRKFRLIKRLFERGLSDERIRQLFRVIDWIMELSQPFDKMFWDEVNLYKEETKLPFITTPERYGRIEGRIEGLIDGIGAFLEFKFGDKGLALMPEIRAVNDQEKLEKILAAIASADNAEELRRIWAR